MNRLNSGNDDDDDDAIDDDAHCLPLIVESVDLIKGRRSDTD